MNSLKASETFACMFQEVADEERSKWMRGMLIMAIGGIILVFSPDIVKYIAGIDIAAPPAGLPAGFVGALTNLNNLLRFMGAIIVVIAGAVYVIKMEFGEIVAVGTGLTTRQQHARKTIVVIGSGRN